MQNEVSIMGGTWDGGGSAFLEDIVQQSFMWDAESFQEVWFFFFI